MNLFIAPHNDDEALFGAYIIQTYKPLVVVVTDSYIQFERGEKECSAENRREESKRACRLLNSPVEFLCIKDTAADETLFSSAMGALWKYGNVDQVFAPAIEDGGNFQHNIIGRVADELYPDVRHYYTYTRDRNYPSGEVKVEATAAMKAIKIQALAEYHSQWNNCCRMYFTQDNKDEYLNA